MRGNNIHLSPLPFLFGVKAKEIQDRYWVRPIAPPAGSQDVWLETYPKRPDDAGNYSRVQIILDKNEVLPKGLVVFMPNIVLSNRIARSTNSSIAIRIGLFSIS